MLIIFNKYHTINYLLRQIVYGMIRKLIKLKLFIIQQKE